MWDLGHLCRIPHCGEFPFEAFVFFVPTSSQDLRVVTRTLAPREGVRIGSLFSLDASWSPCSFTHSDRLCVQSSRDRLFQTIKSLTPFPRAPSACSSNIYITNKGHSQIFPELKADPVSSDFLCSVKPRVLKFVSSQDTFLLLKVIELLFWRSCLSIFTILQIEIEKFKTYIFINSFKNNNKPYIC